MKIGFIGLGIMGKPMAKNLIKKGHALTVFDINTLAVEEVCAAGAAKASSAKEAAMGAELVITMLPNSNHVHEVVTSSNGVLDGSHPGQMYVDMSSISPIVAKEVAAACAQKGVSMLDAPVSGGEPKAVDGTLSIMAGGPADMFERVKDILLCMGASAVLVGDVGAGNVTKLANQVIVALNIAAVSEALTLAKKAGVDAEKVYQAIRGGLAGSTVLDAKAPMMLSHNYKPGFRVELHIKDLKNAMDAAHSVDAPLPLTAQALEMMQALKVEGEEKLDHSALVKYYQRLAGIEL